MVLTFKCGIHSFETESIDKFDEHYEEKEHNISGSAPCVLCGFTTEFEFEGKKKPGAIPCICKECKGKI